MGKLFFTALFVFTLQSICAQDTQYSQFYAAPIYLNPAFTGSANISRVGLNFRNQWPGLDQTFIAYSVYGDHYFEEQNSGIGLIINGSRESLSALQNTEIGLSYAYRVQFGEKSFLQVGVQGSYATRSAAFDDVILSTQLDIDRGVVNPGSGLAIDDRQRSFADLHAGMLYYSDKYWFGVSTHHLNAPEISFFDTDRLPRRYSAHGGIRIPLRSGFINDYFNNTQQERTMSFAFNYKQQGVFDQLDIGTELFFEPIVLGLWYRGLPTGMALPNNEAVIVMVGYALASGLELGYSYDFTLSRLGWRNSGGAHEVSIRYLFVEQLWNKDARWRLPIFKF